MRGQQRGERKMNERDMNRLVQVTQDQSITLAL